MADFEIPLIAAPQQLQVTLSGKSYQLNVYWRDADEGGWVMDIYDAQTSAPILRGVPLITGANLLAQYDYLEFGGSLTVFTDDAPDEVPTFGNLGSQSHLIWTPDA